MKRFIINLLVCVSISNFLGASSDLSSARAHARLGRIAGQVSPAHVEQLQPEGVAATADFLKDPQYCSAVKKRWGQYLMQFRDDIIKEMLENEERYKDDYFVLYHAQAPDGRLVVELLRNLYEFRNKTALRSDFEYLRFWQDGSDYADVNSYLDSFLDIGNFNDHRLNVRAVLLAVNPVLFGNFDVTGECTFDYFLGGVEIGSIIRGMLGQMLEKLFHYYGFDPRYIQKLFDISKAFTPRTGDIVQIFIPKAVVNDCAYLCLSVGKPRKDYIVDKHDNPLALNDYDAVRGRYTRCAGILDIIQKNVTIIKDAQKIQLRLFFSKSGPLLNPGLGAKMFRFTTLAPAQLYEYKKQIRDLSQKIFAGYKGPIDKSPAYAPLFRSGVVQGAKALTAQEEEKVRVAVQALAPLSDLFEVIAEEDPIKLMKELLAKGAHIDAQDKDGLTALMLAMGLEGLDVVEFLIGKGANINAQDKDGQTALMLAAALGRLDVVIFLVEHGARIDAKDRYGEMAWQLAEGQGHKDIVAYLKSAYQKRPLSTGRPIVKSIKSKL